MTDRGCLEQIIRVVEATLDPSVDGVLGFDADERIVAWRGAMSAITGLSEREAFGRRVREIAPLDEGSELFGRQVILFGQSICELVIVAAGEEGGGLAIFKDLSEAMRVREDLAESEARFKTMADGAPVLLWMSREDGLCTFFNETWLRFSGRRLEEEVGVGWAEGLHPEDFQRVMDAYQEALAVRAEFELEYRLRRWDGEYRWILDRGRPRYAPSGSFAGYIGSCVDITERRGLEEELRLSVRARDDFLSMASHELRTPLSPLMLQVKSAQKLLRGADLPADVVHKLGKKLDTAGRQIQRLSRLVSNLVDISRITSFRLDFKSDDLDLVELAREIVARFERDGGEERVVELRAPATLIGRWDRDRLDQVLTNLLSNAFKYGGTEPIVVALEQHAERVRLIVRDRGIGIAPDAVERIFERFERAVPSENYGGLGLGLWIVRRIVEGLGGRITVDTAPGEGAAFTVELPLAPIAREQDTRAERAAPSPPEAREERV